MNKLKKGQGMEEEKKSIVSDEQMEAIAEKAAEKAVLKITAVVYQNVGKSVVERIFWLIGAIVVGAYFWLKSKGAVS